MLLGLVLVLAAARVGLRIRRARALRARLPRQTRSRHLRLAKPGVGLLLAGFVAGPVSAVWLRGWEPFSTFHALLGCATALLLAATGVLGRQLERGAGRREAHALVGVLALLFGACAAFAGLVLLP